MLHFCVSIGHFISNEKFFRFIKPASLIAKTHFRRIVNKPLSMASTLKYDLLSITQILLLLFPWTTRGISLYFHDSNGHLSQCNTLMVL